MTDIGLTSVDLSAIPEYIQLTQAFIARVPNQNTIDLLRRLEPDLDFGELMQQKGPRVAVFRGLQKMYPGRDATSLWLASASVEIELITEDPTNGSGPKTLLPSVPITE
jgi:hypothetical protein